MHPTTSDVVVDDDSHGLYLIARGLGSDPGRTQAAQSAAAAVFSLVLRSISLDALAPLDVLARLAIEDANGVVWRQRAGDDDDDVRVALTLLLVRNGHVAVGHVGHGRVLRVGAGQVSPLTVEHTLLGEHRRLGYPLPAGTNSVSTALTRQLGERMFVDVDVESHPLVPGTTYVLLSSGFAGLEQDESLGTVTSTLELSRVPAKLIELARSGGEQERLSALVVQPGRHDRVTDEPGETALHGSLGQRMWSSLQRSVSRGLMRSQ